jgi:hypothetical protein
MEHWLVMVLMIAGAAAAGFAMGLAAAPAYRAHPDLSKIQRPITSAHSADIERRTME